MRTSMYLLVVKMKQLSILSVRSILLSILTILLSILTCCLSLEFIFSHCIIKYIISEATSSHFCANWIDTSMESTNQ
jgi:hypothetical protein